jgi:hypothetical protein
MSYLRCLCLFGSSLPPLFVGGIMSYLRYLCLFGSSLFFWGGGWVSPCFPYIANFSGLSFLIIVP